MNLENTIKWLKEETEKFGAQGASEEQINVYNKFLAWMEELERWRLMYSETHREIHLNEKNTFSKKYIMDLLDGQFEDWKLKSWGED